MKIILTAEQVKASIELEALNIVSGLGYEWEVHAVDISADHTAEVEMYVKDNEDEPDDSDTA